MRAWLLLLACLPALAAELPTLRVAVGLFLPPYVIREQHGGLEYDIVAEALRRSGYRMQPQYVAYGQIGAMLQRRAVDAAMTQNPAGGLDAHYSEPVVRYHDYAITLSARRISLQRVQDLHAYSMVAFQNAHKELGPAFAELTRNHQRYSETGQQIAQNKLLYSGQVDVVVADKLIFNYYRQLVHGEVDARQPVTFHPLFDPIAYSVAFHDPALRDRFNLALGEMRKDGSVARIEQRYRRYF